MLTTLTSLACRLTFYLIKRLLSLSIQQPTRKREKRLIMLTTDERILYLPSMTRIESRNPLKAAQVRRLHASTCNNLRQLATCERLRILERSCGNLQR